MMAGMQATRLLLVRHGETDWNAGARIQGHLDIALNDTGRLQARRLAAALAGGESIDAIYTSDLVRARETARPLAVAIRRPLVALEALRERHFGRFQGRRFVDVQLEEPDQAEPWRRRDPAWIPPGGGESLIQFEARIRRAVQGLAAENMDRHIAVFTHGGVLDILYRAACGINLRHPRSWSIANASINRLLWTPDSGLSLVGWSDTTHLEDWALDENTV